MDRGKSKDESGIAMEMILHGGPEILEFLTSAFNGILIQRRIDDDWHVTFFTMLPKTGDLASPSNWRPIAILKVTHKLFARILHGRLKQDLYNHQSDE